MFHRLRLQLILINLGIIVLLFLFLTAGTYIVATMRMAERSSHMLRAFTDDIITGRIKEPPLEDKKFPPPPVFFVKVSAGGHLQSASRFSPLDHNGLETLSRQVLQSDKASGAIIFRQVSYMYLQTPLPDSSDHLLVFLENEREWNALHSLLIALGIIGVCFLILSAFGSLYMANRAMVPIQQAWQRQKDFLADASHELRTPLAVIQTNLDIVRSSQQDTVASQEKWLKNIQEESAYMAKLIDSLLFLARSDGHQQILHKQWFPLQQALKAAIKPLTSIAEAYSITLSIDAEAEIMFYGDEDRIRQLISILVDNAIRHTPCGGIIEIKVHRTSRQVKIEVTDSGEGISAEHLPKIFDRFYQVDEARAKGGAGLGLSIAKSIVESHGGSIDVSSKLQTGTTFIIRLPVE